MASHTVTDHELWLDSAKGYEHMLLVSFSYRFIDAGMGWSEWCGIPACDVNIVPSIEIDDVAVVSVSGTRKRYISPHDELIRLITSRLEDDYDFDYEE